LRADRQDRHAYVSFWTGVGASFPSLKGAASTKYYFECERMLCEEFFQSSQNLLLLKSDLWDEAKNSEILLWAADHGIRPVGVDIALDIVQQARCILDRHRPGLAVADVRSLPFPGNTFDLIYSMGTIEHFPEYETAVQEFFRVLKPGGRAIIGVPNKLDPFLRPVLVCLLNGLGLYSYGMEKSFTPGELRRLLSGAGFRVTGQSGILFMPGWLRMLDLFCHAYLSSLSRLTGLFTAPFSWLYRRFPSLRRHGYLIVCAVAKPAQEPVR
jgi:SAM-dependent methyltransferase